MLALTATITMAAQGWPSQYDGVMLQGFYWDSYDDSQWSVLEAQADRLQGTFDLVWLPQSGNCGGTSMGYDDLYWFSNYNSSFGNEQQLRSLINTFKANEIKTIADDARTLSEQQIIDQYYKYIEEDICADPANYLWSHRRWHKLPENEQ